MQFAVGAEYNNEGYFYGVCQAILPYNIDFIISCGDNCPPPLVDETIHAVLGAGLIWYPGIGNHEVESFAFLDAATDIIMKLPDIRVGFKKTVYSFDRDVVHFSYLDLYQKTNDADVYDELYDWLQQDLAGTRQPIKFVIGHEPAYPKPDADCGRSQYIGNCLDEHPVNRDRFWKLLQEYQVAAYWCGHTHNYNANLIDGVWQINLGHARGKMELDAPATFAVVETHRAEGIEHGGVTVTVYRDNHNGVYDYLDIVHRIEIWIGNNDGAPGEPRNLKVKKE